MKISDLINNLNKLKESEGDKEVYVTISGSFERHEISSVGTSLIHPGRIIIDVKKHF